jgi:hypothetical protein
MLRKIGWTGYASKRKRREINLKNIQATLLKITRPRLGIKLKMILNTWD